MENWKKTNMPELSRRDVLRLGAGLACLAPQVVSAAGRIRFTKYEILPTRIPMVDRVRDAWIASYKLQGTFQTHYNPVFVRLYTDEGLTGTAESLVGVPQTESILKRLIGKSPVEFWQDDSIQGVLMGVHDILGQASGLPICRLLSSTPKSRI